MADEITIKTFRPDDLAELVALINEADAVDRLEKATTVEQMGHEMSFPSAHPETDCFLAWYGDRLVGYTDFFVNEGDSERGDECTIYCWGVVHPEWRRQGLGRRLLETTFRRAEEILPSIKGGRVNVQCSPRDSEVGRMALCESFGMEPVRYFVNLVRPLNGDLPPVKMPAGIQLRTFDEEQDIKAVWQVDNVAFRDHWGHAESKLEEFVHWIKMPHFRPDLWFLAEEEMSGEVVGLGLNIIDPDWIAQTGRREGYVDTLAVLREHRHKGIGTALLVQSLHAFSRSGMEAAHLHADAENLTGAMRLYEGLGFRIRTTSIAYRSVLEAK